MIQVRATKVASGSSLEGQKPYNQSPDARKPRFLEQSRQGLRSRHYGRRTKQTYCQWAKRFTKPILQKAVDTAFRRAGLAKQAPCYKFRRSLATHLVKDGHRIRTDQRLLGRRHLRTTIIYTRVLNRGPPGAASDFALGRNQRVRPTKKLHKILLIRKLRSVKTKIGHKKQRFERLYYEGLAPSARDRIYPQVCIQPRHAAHARQFLTM